MYVGRDFKRDIKLDSSKIYKSKLKPNRRWLDLFSLSLSNYFRFNKFDFTNLTDNLSKDEVIIIDSHDDIFKDYQIHYWRKDTISDILPAIKCPSFKSEIKFFKTSETYEIWKFINDQIHTKSFVIENIDDELSINLVYGNTVKIAPYIFDSSQQTKFFNKLNERYGLWEIDDCACKPKKIRVWERDFDQFQHTIEELERISIIKDTKHEIYILFETYFRSSLIIYSMVFNHSARWMSDKDTNFIFTGDTLAVVYHGNYYNFRLDQNTKESKHSYIKGKI